MYLGEAILSQEGELEFLPSLVEDRAIPAHRSECGLPADLVIAEEVRIIRWNVGSPVHSAGPETARPGRVDHMIVGHLPREVQPVDVPIVLGPPWPHGAVGAQDAEIGAGRALCCRRPDARSDAGAAAVARTVAEKADQRVVVFEEAETSGQRQPFGQVEGKFSERRVVAVDAVLLR